MHGDANQEKHRCNHLFFSAYFIIKLSPLKMKAILDLRNGIKVLNEQHNQTSILKLCESLQNHNVTDSFTDVVSPFVDRFGRPFCFC